MLTIPKGIPIRLAVLLLFLLPNHIFAQDTTNQTHIIQSGENLFRIALSYGLTTEQLATANNITNPTTIYAGQVLVIPGTTAPSSSTTVVEVNNSPVETITTNTAPSNPQYHVIQRGETLRTIAQRYSTTEANLIQLNNITNPNRILYGQTLTISGNSAAIVNTVAESPTVETSSNTESTPALIHVVQPGEYLSGIARRYGVSYQDVLNSNSIFDPNRLLVGQQLVIPNGATQSTINTALYPEPGARVNTGREVVVDLSNSRTYAYENGILVYEAIGSMGLPATPTVMGNFTVQRKVRSQTMSGPGYWLPNVEWVVYFYQGYALHGAYWHNNFGQPMSHGCVNLTNDDAQWFYNFVDIGTPVTVQY